MGTRILFRAVALTAAIFLVGGHAGATNRVVGLVSSEPGAALVKRFHVPAGFVVTGIEFVNNDDRSEFPKVVLLRGPAVRLSEATVVAEVTSVRASARHLVRVSVPPTLVESTEDLYVAVSFPASTGVRGVGDGAGIGATQLSTFGDCYIAPTMGESFQAIDLDLAMSLLYRSVGKAENPGDMKAILPTFLAGLPNPVTSFAQVKFGLDRAGPVTLAIYNVAGRRIRLLVRGTLEAGVHSVVWDGKDDQGQDLASGVYMAKLQASGTVLLQKMVIAK